MASNTVMIHKLQQAINGRGDRIMYSTSQFYSEQNNRPVTIYHIKRAMWDDSRGKWVNEELFHSTSQIQIVLYLRDLWYVLNGKEPPTDNEMWNAIKEKFKA